MVLGRMLKSEKQEKGLKIVIPSSSRESGGGGNRAAANRRIEERKSKQLGSRGGGGVVVGVSDDGESKGFKKGSFVKRYSKTRSFGEKDGSRDAGNRGVRSFNGDRKRKSMDAGMMVENQERGSDRNAGRFTRKPTYKAGQDKHGDDAYRARHGREEKVDRFDRSSQDVSWGRRKDYSRDEFSDKKNAQRNVRDEPVIDGGYRNGKGQKDYKSQDVSLGRRNSYSQDEFLDKKNARHNVKDELVKDGGYRNGMGQKDSKTKYEVTKQSEQGERKLGPITPRRSSKKKIEIQNFSKANDFEGVDEPEKKKRRRIRIHRFDTSNKRINDEIESSDIVPKKEDDSVQKKENDTNLGVNAQFRAIVPSRSILSFVEDNLLGRRREIDFRRAGYNTELPFPLDNIPHSSSSERERIEETVFRNNLTFFAAAKVSSSLPPPDLPEIAFAGRSNVGKSSLLNALTRQWGVVRTSDKPGLTQTVNFFSLATKLCLVDLPGYGFAYAKDEVKEDWEELVKEYVSTRENLKRVCLLVDAKWGMKPLDRQFIDLMERSQTKYQIVLTKTDTVFPIDVARRAMQIEESLKKNKSVVQPLMMVCSKNGAGIRSLRAAVSKLARYVKP